MRDEPPPPPPPEPRAEDARRSPSRRPRPSRRPSRTKRRRPPRRPRRPRRCSRRSRTRTSRSTSRATRSCRATPTRTPAVRRPRTGRARAPSAQPAPQAVGARTGPRQATPSPRGPTVRAPAPSANTEWNAPVPAGGGHGADRRRVRHAADRRARRRDARARVRVLVRPGQRLRARGAQVRADAALSTPRSITTATHRERHQDHGSLLAVTRTPGDRDDRRSARRTRERSRRRCAPTSSGSRTPARSASRAGPWRGAARTAPDARRPRTRDCARALRLRPRTRPRLAPAPAHSRPPHRARSGARPPRRRRRRPLTSASAARHRGRGCTRCVLSATRTQTVFSRGNPARTLCFIGEAPGADEDAQGLPVRRPRGAAPRPDDRRDGAVARARRLRLQHPQVPPAGQPPARARGDGDVHPVPPRAARAREAAGHRRAWATRRSPRSSTRSSASPSCAASGSSTAGGRSSCPRTIRRTCCARARSRPRPSGKRGKTYSSS